MPKNAQTTYCTIALMSHASKVMLKILQARLQQYVNCELPDVQDRLRKLEGTKCTKGTLHAKMGSIKDRNAMDLTEAKDIKKRWQEYTEELYKKGLCILATSS